ncbi:beta-1,3-galactosyltransferase 5-like [Drosophila obscura]|uniref:beta-1,3-galactosyltransferase 5-like n=1 Tax=Drosophila obscura TaxID=7282 RepID=UPI001BB256A4|nr:beta-1,3-galactosyltransferase 5-like [Drosophila obscura]
MRFFMFLGSVIIITYIYASLSAKERKPLHSVGGFTMRHDIEENVTRQVNGSNNHGKTIENYQHTERGIMPEKKNLVLVHSTKTFSADLNPLPKSAESEDIKNIIRNRLLKYPRKPKKMLRNRNQSLKPLTTVSSVKTSSAAPVLPVLTPVLTMKLYETGHLNEEIDIQRICTHGGSSLKLLILITSAQSHSMERMSIRQTWMHYASWRDVGMAFVLGRTTNATLKESLNQENYIYGDMIRGNFIDSYLNLTLKTISMLEWVDTHCPRVKYILKTDDDMFINVPKLLDFIDEHKDKRTIYGRLAEEQEPERNRGSKYFVPYHQFRGAEFPKYTTGGAYLLTGDIVHELYMESLNMYYVQLEDVFTTGIVAQSLKIRRVQADEFRNVRTTFNACYIRSVISVNKLEVHEQYYLWRKMLDPSIKCKGIWRMSCGAVEQPK